jgi:hypothetical protein
MPISNWINRSVLAKVVIPLIVLIVLIGVVVGSRTPNGGRNSEQSALDMLGASGVFPKNDSLNVDALTSLLESGRMKMVSFQADLTIPPVALHAYQRTEQILTAKMSECGLSWPVIAALGKVISNHGDGAFDADGRTLGPILGPPLDGSMGVPLIRDTDGGRLDGDTTWDRAAGPMQIIPPVWHRLGADSDGDGIADPHSIFDASLAAGRYLCQRGVNLREPAQLAEAVFHYQRSNLFVRVVLIWSSAYGETHNQQLLPVAAPLRQLPPAESVTLPSEAPPPPARLPAGPVRAPVSNLPRSDAPPGSIISPTQGSPWPNPGATATTTPEPPPGSTTNPTTSDPPPTTVVPSTTIPDPPPTTVVPPTTTPDPPSTTSDPPTAPPTPTTTTETISQ